MTKELRFELYESGRELRFELYEGGSRTTNTFEVYEDYSMDAVKNSYYYDSATYNSNKLSGTNVFTVFEPHFLAPIGMLFRIRILYNGSLRFCSAWFKLSENGYADYIPYYGTNGPSNGLYRIYVASDNLLTSKKLSGVTTLDKDLPIKKTIPCNICVFWGGGEGLSGATKYPPIVGAATVNIGDTYEINLPSSTLNLSSKNNLSYSFRHHIMEEPNGPHSYINDYGLDCSGTTFKIPLMTNKKYDIHFVPRDGVICTGQMAEAISYYAKEFDDNQCIPNSKLSSNGFISTEPNNCLPRFNTVKKKNAIFLYTSFRTSGSVVNMTYTFSGNSNSMTITADNFPIASAVTYCLWQAEIADFLGTTYTNTDLQKKVRVSIGGRYLLSQEWYYKVVAYDGTIIKQTSRISSDGFTTTMDKLDGAIVFISKNSTINEYYIYGSKRARDGEKNITSTSVYCSWPGGYGGVTTSSLASIGEFDYGEFDYE